MPSFGGGLGGGPGGGGGSSTVKYQLVVTSGMIAARQFDLISAPSGSVWLTLVSVGSQLPASDYTVSGSMVSWSPIGGLFDVLAAGDVLIVEYVAA